MQSLVRFETTSKPGTPQVMPYPRQTKSFVDWECVEAVTRYPASGLDGFPAFRPTIHMRNGGEHYALCLVAAVDVPLAMVKINECLRSAAETDGFADLGAYLANPAELAEKYAAK